MQLQSSTSKFEMVLRPLKDEDAQALSSLANNKNVWDNLRDQLPHPYSLKDAEFFIDLTKKEEPRVTFAIVVDGKFCGVIGLILQSDVYRLSAELGYWIGEPYWGKGIATEAVAVITRYGFEDLGMVRVFAEVYEYNLNSMRVLEKNGFEKEGVARKAVIKNGKVWDKHLFGRVND